MTAETGKFAALSARWPHCMFASFGATMARWSFVQMPPVQVGGQHKAERVVPPLRLWTAYKGRFQLG